MDLVYSNGMKGKVVPFPPGYFETYSVLPSGKVKLVESKRFHRIGNAPLYKTLVPPHFGDYFKSLNRVFKYFFNAHLI